MKVTLNIGKLFQEQKITREEHDRILSFARQESSKHAWGMVSLMGLIAVALGAIGLFPSFFSEIGALFYSIYLMLGWQAFCVLIFVLILGTGVFTRSGFLVGISCFVVLSFLVGTTLYTHVEYIVVIKEPAVTVFVFSLLAIASLLLSKKLSAEYERLALIFSRTCLILVNMGFWVGSLWGSASPLGKIPDWGFSIAWAVCLLITLVWGAKAGRLFVVNVAISFGTIHLYTQWFAYFGADPFSLFASGLIAAGLAIAVPRYNRYLKQQSATVAAAV